MMQCPISIRDRVSIRSWAAVDPRTCQRPARLPSESRASKAAAAPRGRTIPPLTSSARSAAVCAYLRPTSRNRLRIPRGSRTGCWPSRGPGDAIRDARECRDAVLSWTCERNVLNKTPSMGYSLVRLLLACRMCARHEAGAATAAGADLVQADGIQRPKLRRQRSAVRGHPRLRALRSLLPALSSTRPVTLRAPPRPLWSIPPALREIARTWVSTSLKFVGNARVGTPSRA